MKAAKTWRAWTSKELEQLETMRLEGRSAPEIARTLGRTVPSVRCRLTTNQLQRGSRLAKYIPLLTVRHSCTEAAKQLGVSLKYVSKVKAKLERMGFRVYRQKANQNGVYRVVQE
jgi:hypothetical protein